MPHRSMTCTLNVGSHVALIYLGVDEVGKHLQAQFYIYNGTLLQVQSAILLAVDRSKSVDTCA